MFESMKRAMRAISREIEHKLKLGKKAIPYRLWAALPQRLAAPAVQTRQCKRNLLFRAAFDTFTRMYPGEPRARRRTMARTWAKNRWKEPLRGVEVGA